MLLQRVVQSDFGAYQNYKRIGFWELFISGDRGQVGAFLWFFGNNHNYGEHGIPQASQPNYMSITRLHTKTRAFKEIGMMTAVSTWISNESNQLSVILG